MRYVCLMVFSVALAACSEPATTALAIDEAAGDQLRSLGYEPIEVRSWRVAYVRDARHANLCFLATFAPQTSWTFAGPVDCEQLVAAK